MGTKIGYLGQWNSHIDGSTNGTCMPIAQSNSSGGYVNTTYYWNDGGNYTAYYTINTAHLQLDPYEYPTHVEFSDYMPGDGYWGNDFSDEYGEGLVTFGLCCGAPTGTPPISANFLTSYSLKKGSRKQITGTWEVPAAQGKQMAGNTLSIMSYNAGNCIPKLYGYCKVTITTSYLYTKCGAPKDVAGSYPSDGWITLTWKAGSDGTANKLTAYEIQYSDSSDAINWGGWFAGGQTNASTRTAQMWNNPESGKYRRFRVRAVGAAGAEWASDWVVSNVVPTDDNVPTFNTSVTSVTASGVLHTVTAGTYIKGLTKIQASISNAQAHAPKSVASYSIDMQQYGKYNTSNPASGIARYTSGVVDATGTVTITYQVTDNYGYVGTMTRTITVLDYYKPSVQIQFARCKDVNLTPDPMGKYVMYKATTTYTAVDGNAIASVKVKIGSKTYTLTADGVWRRIANYTQDPTVSQRVTVTVTDKFTAYSVQKDIMSANYAIYLNEDGSAIGFGTATSHTKSVEIAPDRTLYVNNIVIPVDDMAYT